MKSIVINSLNLSFFLHNFIKLILCPLALLLATQTSAADEWFTVDEQTDPQLVSLSEKLDYAFEHGALKNLHGLVVIKNKRLLMEKYYPGNDQVWGMPLGKVKFDQYILHDLRSITKSIVSLLYGIAHDRKLVPGVNTPVIESFPAYEELAQNPDVKKITIENVLSMSMGLYWDESLPYSNPFNSEIAMERAEDRYHYILSREVLHPAGEAWEYSGGTTALLGKIIQQNTAVSISEFAQENLFGPLGIKEFEWTQGFNGEESTASGLRLLPRDLAKMGQLILNKGVWNEQQVVSSEWLDASFQPHAQTTDELQYGYQWWLGSMRDSGEPWISGFGNGSQRLVVIPSLELVVVITAGNYNQAQQWKLPVKLMTEFILPAIKGL